MATLVGTLSTPLQCCHFNRILSQILSIYIIINKNCAALKPHKCMGAPLGPPLFQDVDSDLFECSQFILRFCLIKIINSDKSNKNIYFYFPLKKEKASMLRYSKLQSNLQGKLKMFFEKNCSVDCHILIILENCIFYKRFFLYCKCFFKNCSVDHHTLVILENCSVDRHTLVILENYKRFFLYCNWE